MKNLLSLSATLPVDVPDALLIGRVWVEGSGPVLALVNPGGVFDLSSLAPTASQLLELPDLARAVRAAAPSLPRLAGTAEVLANSAADAQDPKLPWLLAPCDLQALKASGVTFVESMLERVIEEHAGGDASKADGARKTVIAVDAGRNLAVLVEAAVRNTILQLRGIDTYTEFIARHHKAMSKPE